MNSKKEGKDRKIDNALAVIVLLMSLIIPTDLLFGESSLLFRILIYTIVGILGLYTIGFLLGLVIKVAEKFNGTN